MTSLEYFFFKFITTYIKCMKVFDQKKIIHESQAARVEKSFTFNQTCWTNLGKSYTRFPIYQIKKYIYH